MWPFIHNFIVEIINGSYMFQLHSSHHQAVYVRSIRGNFIPAAYIRLKMIRGRRYLTLHIAVYGCYRVKCVHSIKGNV